MYGFFKNKRIVLYDTLIDQCKEDQVVAVLAHELGESPSGDHIWPARLKVTRPQDVFRVLGELSKTDKRADVLGITCWV